MHALGRGVCHDHRIGEAGSTAGIAQYDIDFKQATLLQNIYCDRRLASTVFA